MKNKKAMLFVVLVVIAILALPVANLIFKPQPSVALSSTASGDFVTVAKILDAKCAMCHTEGETLPFYASLPIASGVIQADIESGLDHLDLASSLSSEQGQGLSEPALAMIEYTINEDRMPPTPFLAMHWDGALSSSEKKTILDWVAKVREETHRSGNAADEFANEPVQPLPAEHGQDPVIAALGDKMFHEVRLSGDNTLSCASCHGLDKGGTDQAQFSTG
ncbi:MAG: heme-binding domain-containing protein, partial [Candidatus Omnitrophica bacterium]|nr:heme-binding domain-containing protein [Candidatus Omnitrophota bacterium]